jgi:hypothetical protein
MSPSPKEPVPFTFMPLLTELFLLAIQFHGELIVDTEAT